MGSPDGSHVYVRPPTSPWDVQYKDFGLLGNPGTYMYTGSVYTLYVYWEMGVLSYSLWKWYTWFRC